MFAFYVDHTLPMQSSTEDFNLFEGGHVDNTGSDAEGHHVVQQQIVEELLHNAHNKGATAAEVAVSAGNGLAINVRMGQIESIEHTQDKELRVSVFFNHKKGSASTTDFSPAALKDTVTAACNIAKYTAEDHYAGLADAEHMATKVLDLNLHHPWDLQPSQAINMALHMEQVARDYDQRITNSEGASVSRSEDSYLYGNSHGFTGSYNSTAHSCSCCVIASDDSGMQRDNAYSCDRNAANLWSLESIGQEAARRTVLRLQARQLRTCKTPVIYQAEVARSLFRHLVSAVSGTALYHKATFLLDKVGQQVMTERVHVSEQPHLLGALGSAPFDQDGIATTDSDLIADGVLQRYVLSSYSARRLGLQPTGNAGGVHNLTVRSDDLSAAQLMRKMDTGLLITELMGMSLNLITGDYSRGAAGYWVENGEIAYAVEEITVAGNLKDMFFGIQGIGNDIDKRSNIRSGSVLIEEMAVAGQ